ncbi:MAG: hypothetical protein RIR26_1052 [Pseudomonadota bacterium]|jgi:hypothetical protein
MRLLALALFGFLILPHAARAQQNNFALVSPPAPTKGYGMSGCGLGSVLLPNGPQAVSSILNSLFWNQVFVISSGTSNCQNDPMKQAGLDQEQFMRNNYRTIAREAAQGNGESLRGLARTLGCQADQDRAFSEFTQKKHQRIFSSTGALAALQTLKKELVLESRLANACTYASLPVGRSPIE